MLLYFSFIFKKRLILIIALNTKNMENFIEKFVVFQFVESLKKKITFFLLLFMQIIIGMYLYRKNTLFKLEYVVQGSTVWLQIILMEIDSSLSLFKPVAYICIYSFWKKKKSTWNT